MSFENRLKNLLERKSSSGNTSSNKHKWLYLSSTGVKLVILDEADAMTQDAQSALRRGILYKHNIYAYISLVIEKYTSNTRFCMICNYVNKIMPALQSRCTRYITSAMQLS